MDGDGEDDYVFVGTPIEREEDTSARKRKAVADAGQLRTLPSWKQEVRDEEGRRRFHGAFTGGFSAGYYNTVGSKEGWTPQTFTSSRKNRAEVKQQSIYSFLDDEDLKGMGGHALETSMQFDTFGSTAAEYARKQAEKEQTKRPSAIPGPVHDDLIVPASNSIGVKLLLKMGWRHGHSIKGIYADSLHEARREARKAFLAFSGNDNADVTEAKTSMIDSDEFVERSKEAIYASKNTPVYVLQPKKDLYGLGFDPYKHAPEFRDKKRLEESRYKRHGNYAPGFGIGALEELDVEDEDIYASIAFEQNEVEEIELPKLTKDTQYRLEDRKDGGLRGFKVASSTDYVVERFPPPNVPASFKPHHKFPVTVETIPDLPPPIEVLPPEDTHLKLLIDGFASLVARCGKLFEDLSKEKNKSNPLFSFLNGGNGSDYYERRLWEEKQKNTNLLRPPEPSKSNSSFQKMTAENRGRILGEKPLQKSSIEITSPATIAEVVRLQANLSSTFKKPESDSGLHESTKPFKNDPAKQERFEQFLKDKYHGGLRSTFSSGTNIMSEADRARERLDFEAAAEAIEKGQLKMDTAPSSNQSFMNFLEAGSQQFVLPASEKHQAAQNEDKVATKLYPKREEFQWYPLPILCKRFDIIDPYMGKPRPLPRPKSKLDTLFFMSDSVKSAAKMDDVGSVKRDAKAQSEQQDTDKPASDAVPDIEQLTKNAERPVDLYKAIFSDDSDEDEDVASTSQTTGIDAKSEGVNQTLNRLVAGDFLETLGKELGLEVPVDTEKKSTTLVRNDTEIASSHHIDKKATDTPVKESDAINIERSPDAIRGGNVAEVSTRFDKVENQEKKSRQHSRRDSSRRSRYSDSSDDEDQYKRSRRKHSSNRRSSITPSSDSDEPHSKSHSRSKSRRRSRHTDSSDERSVREKRSSKAHKSSSRHHKDKRKSSSAR